MKKRVKLSEAQLHNLIKESVNNVLNEMDVLDNEYFHKGTNPNTKEGYLKMLFAHFLNDGMNPKEALDRALEEVNNSLPHNDYK